MAESVGLLELPPHRSGTSWEPWYLVYRTKVGDEPAEPVDLAGAYARVQFTDRWKAVQADWMTDDHPDTEDRTGRLEVHADTATIWMVGPETGPLVLPVGLLEWTLKVWLADGQVYEDVEGTLFIEKGQPT